MNDIIIIVIIIIIIISSSSSSSSSSIVIIISVKVLDINTRQLEDWWSYVVLWQQT